MNDSLTSSQKAVLALEVEERLAEEARARRLAGLKQNQTNESLRNELSNGSGEPLNNYLSNGNSKPLDNSFLRNKAAVQAAGVAGTNPQYVREAKRIRRLAPELLEPICDGLITIPQAKKIAALSGKQRIAVIEQIKSGVPVAQAILQAPQEEEDQTPLHVMASSRWANFMYKIRIFLNSLKRQGGIAKLSRTWDRKGKRHYLTELREVRDAINKCIEYLEKELSK